MNRFPFPMRYTIPLGLVMLLISFLTYHTWLEYGNMLERIDTDLKREVLEEGIELSATVEFLMSKGEMEAARNSVARRLSELEVVSIMVVDTSGRIVISSENKYKGGNFAATPYSVYSAMISNSISQGVPISMEDPTGMKIAASFPIEVEEFDGKLTGHRPGALFTLHDFKGQIDGHFRNMVEEFVKYALAVMLLSVPAWYFFRKSVTDRVIKLASAAHRIADGDLAFRAELEGSDELAYLSREFDIMARKLERSNARLIESESRYRGLVENLNEHFFFILDRGGRFTFASSSVRWVLGYDDTALNGRDFISMFTGADESRMPAAEAMRLVLAGTPVPPFEVEVRHSSGLDLWLLVSPVPSIGPGGSTETVEGIAQDITVRKSADLETRRLAAAVEQTAEAIVITDPDGTISYVNPAFTKISGYSPAEALGRNPSILKSGKHDQKFYESMWQTITSGRVWSGKITNKAKDGRLYEEEAVITPILNPAAKIVSYVAVKRDITAEIEMERQLLQSQKMEAVGRLAGGIAHDFNNLLTAIMGFTQMALADTRSDSVRDSLGKAVATMHRAKDIVGQILAYSRKAPPTLGKVEIMEVVAEAVEIVSASAPRNIEISPLYSAAGESVSGNRAQLLQVMMNLLTNALHAVQSSGKPAGVISVKMDRKELRADDIRAGFTGLVSGTGDIRPGRYVSISVADSGAGIEQQTLEHIFEPFFTTKETGSGSGMGLAVVHGIVQKHKGFVTVSSQLGAGTEFRVFFPLMEKQAEMEAPAKPVQPAGAANTASAAVTGKPLKPRVLFVDDENEIADLAQRSLARMGFDVMATTSSESAWREFQAAPQSFDAVVTDCNMPGLTGDELAKRMLALRPEIPVILCTGHSERVTPEYAMKIGVKKYFEKPYMMADIAGELKLLLGD